MEEFTEFTQKIAQAGHGVISIIAQQSLDDNNAEGFIDYLGQQACVDAPAGVRRIIGDDLYNEIVVMYCELPEEKKTYTTGKPLDADLRYKLAAANVQAMLKKGKVIAFINPETFQLIKGKIEVHPNLRFMVIDRVEKGTIVFSESPSFDFLTDQLFSSIT